jgi:hypothetical protein
LTKLPTITKKNLSRVGIAVEEATAKDWIDKGFAALDEYLLKQNRFLDYLEALNEEG